MTELHELSAVRLRELLAQGELRALELTEHYLDRIYRLDPEYGAFITVTRDAALERAADLDAARDRGDAHAARRHEAPLWGLPFADKDLLDRAGVPTTYGSRAMAGYVPTRSHPLAATMDAAGGVSLGKTNTPEFGLPSHTRNRLDLGPARNPWAPDRDPGGSSGGAAVAVAARLLPFAPGTDGGGSIRIPAAACGLVGLKPSRGRVPDASGIDSLAGLVVGGPIARSVEDAALLLDGMIARGHGGAVEDRFALTAPAGERSYLDALAVPVRRLRIGWNTWSPWASDYDIVLDDERRAVLDDTVRLLERFGHEVIPVEPRTTPEYVRAFRTVWMAGAASIPLDDAALEHVEPLTRWLVGEGRKVPAGSLASALAALSAIEAQLIAEYSCVDVVLTPSLAMPPRPLDWYDEADGERNFEQQCRFTPYTSYLNVAGLPAITLPVSSAPIPAGVQAIGRRGDEVTLLRLGLQLERELGWAERVPASLDAPSSADRRA